MTRVRSTFRSIIDWLRAGYPDEGPRTGHSPLLALTGPIALSPRQTDQIVNELGAGPTDSVDIKVAITKTTDRLPTETQIRKVARALDQKTQRR